MKIEGSYTLRVPRNLAWQRLLDPQALARALPGCEKFEPDPADGSYRAELRVGIGQIKGTYHGRIEILEPVPPERYKLKIEGKGTDRKSTRLNSSHGYISYAVFCLKK